MAEDRLVDWDMMFTFFVHNHIFFDWLIDFVRTLKRCQNTKKTSWQLCPDVVWRLGIWRQGESAEKKLKNYQSAKTKAVYTAHIASLKRLEKTSTLLVLHMETSWGRIKWSSKNILNLVLTGLYCAIKTVRFGYCRYCLSFFVFSLFCRGKKESIRMFW